MALKQEETEVVVDYGYGSDDDDDDDDEEEGDDIVYMRDISSQPHRDLDREMRAADRLSIRLLAVEDDEEEENRLLRKSLRLAAVFSKNVALDNDADDEEIDDFNNRNDDIANQILLDRKLIDGIDQSPRMSSSKEGMRARKRVWTMIIGAIAGLVLVITGIILVGQVTGPPYQPVGPYTLIERQTGEDFFQYYNFYDGADSVGSNGYNQYVNHEYASNRGILNVTEEVDETYDGEARTFIYMGSAPTDAGPRDSIRLEGTRRFNRGLFMYVNTWHKVVQWKYNLQLSHERTLSFSN